MPTADQVQIPGPDGSSLDGLWLDGPRSLFVFAHGAGAGMRHPFMRDLAERLQVRGVATLRFDFPYITAGRRLPPRAHTLTEVARAAVAFGRARAGDRPVWAGGKSMGGRVTSMAEAADPLGIDGLMFLGFPLHPAKRPSVDRAEHLSETSVPLRFVSGSRDALARNDLLRETIDQLGSRAELHRVEAADHGFGVLVRSGRTRDEVMDELAGAVAAWIV